MISFSRRLAHEENYEYRKLHRLSGLPYDLLKPSNGGRTFITTTHLHMKGNNTMMILALKNKLREILPDRWCAEFIFLLKKQQAKSNHKQKGKGDESYVTKK